MGEESQQSTTKPKISTSLLERGVRNGISILFSREQRAAAKQIVTEEAAKSARATPQDRRGHS